MRRLLTILVILIVALVAGLTTLMMLVNPNDFRYEIERLAEQKSGYRLQLEGDLRWHFWPQFSILTGQMKLTAPGAQQPVISAENIRLDVKFWPLLVRQLSIEQVLLKRAVIRLMPESHAQLFGYTPAVPQSTTAYSVNTPSWNWGIRRIQVKDSLLVWQGTKNEHINVRDLDFLLSYNDQQQVTLSLSSQISRDQRELTLSFESHWDLSHYSADISKLSYQLRGVGIPTKGIQGSGAVKFEYQPAKRQLNITQWNLMANGVPFRGQLTAFLRDVPDITITAFSSDLDLDRLLDTTVASPTTESWRQEASVRSGSVYQPIEAFADFDILTHFNAKVSFSAAKGSYRDIPIERLQVKVDNQRGNVTLNQASAELLGGKVALKGSMSSQQFRSCIELQPNIENVELAGVLKAFSLPELVSGKATFKGRLSHSGVESLLTLQNWQGKAQVQVRDVRMYGLNVQQLIQQFSERSRLGVRGKDAYDHYTDVQELNVDTVLQPNGKLFLNRLRAHSSVLNLRGGGSIDLIKHFCNLNLKVLVSKDWQGKTEIVNLLRESELPLRIFGPWGQLSYQVKIEQLLKNVLEEELKRKLKAIDGKVQGKERQF